MPGWHRTKILCTLGPATDRAEVLEELVRAGMDVARVNTAHGDAVHHRRRIQTVRQIARKLGKPLGILVDLPGPKFRLGKLPDGSGELRQGSKAILTPDTTNDPQAIPITDPRLAEQVKAGEPIYLADGTVKLLVARVEAPRIHCEVIVGGTVRSGSGMNLPESDLAVELPTEEDTRWIAFARDEQAEWIGVSFVRTPEELARVRRILGDSDDHPMVMAKIEKRQALEHLEAIVGEADGVMVARGDLGVETPLAEIPFQQKRIIATANELGKPVVTATQLLESMVEHPTPTRAEVTDVANAILDGSDAVMLSAETAIGRHPVEAVRVLCEVARATEARYPYGRLLEQLSRTVWSSVADAVSFVACRLSFDVHAKAIIVPAETTGTAFRIARFRPLAPVVAFSSSPNRAQQLALAWNVYPVLDASGATRSLELARRWLLEHQLAARGDPVVVISAASTDPRHVSDSIQVVQL